MLIKEYRKIYETSVSVVARNQGEDVHVGVVPGSLRRSLVGSGEGRLSGESRSCLWWGHWYVCSSETCDAAEQPPHGSIVEHTSLTTLLATEMRFH